MKHAFHRSFTNLTVFGEILCDKKSKPFEWNWLLKFKT